MELPEELMLCKCSTWYGVALCCSPPLWSVSIYLLKTFILICLARGESVLNVHNDWSSWSQAFFISIGHCVASDSSLRATRALCLAPEMLQGSHAPWSCLLQVVLAGLLGWQSQAEAWGEQSWDAQVPVSTTWPLALSGLVPRRLVVPSCSVPQEQSIGNRESITSGLDYWNSKDFAQTTFQGRLKSNHTTMPWAQDKDVPVKPHRKSFGTTQLAWWPISGSNCAKGSILWWS